MFRLLGVAALALAAANPALAQGKGNDNPGKGQGKSDHAAMNHGAGNQDDGKPKVNAGNRGNGPDKPAKADNSANGSARGLDRVARDQAPGRTRAAGAGSNARSDVRGDVRGDRAVSERMDYRDGRRGRNDDSGNRGDWNLTNIRWVDRDRFYSDIPSCPPGLARKNNGCLPPGLARQTQIDDFGYYYRPALFGIPLRGTSDYVYYNGYLIPSQSGGHFLPLLGGALAVGQIWPEAYPSLRLNDWQQSYYGFEDPYDYRYADNVIYEVDPATSAIEAVVALLTGSDFSVGERLPSGYDVYNVPAEYRDDYYDSDEALYRYSDGQVLQIDPTTMLIEQIIELIA